MVHCNCIQPNHTQSGYSSHSQDYGFQFFDQNMIQPLSDGYHRTAEITEAFFLVLKIAVVYKKVSEELLASAMLTKKCYFESFKSIHHLYWAVFTTSQQCHLLQSLRSSLHRVITKRFFFFREMCFPLRD